MNADYKNILILQASQMVFLSWNIPKQAVCQVASSMEWNFFCHIHNTDKIFKM